MKSSETRTRVGRFSAVAAGVLLGLVLLSGLALARNIHANNPEAFPPESYPYGKSYAEWASQLAKAIFENVFDPEGCSFGQEGNVIFMRASVGGPETFTCSVPSGTSLFLVLLAQLQVAPWDCEFVPNCTYEELTERARMLNTPLEQLFAEVDGTPLQNLMDYQADGVEYSGTAVPGNIWDYYGLGLVGPYGPGAVSGWFVMLYPLPPGEHVIRFGAVVGEPNSFAPETTLYLTVTPDGGIRARPRRRPQRCRPPGVD